MNVEYLDRYQIEPELETRARAFLPGNEGEDRWEKRLKTLSAEDFDRAALADALHNYNLSIANDEAALANTRRLAAENAVAVVTGQQAGLFTGPLYTIHKAITAIRLAAVSEERLGVPVIPIYWNATEDHDLSEIASARFPEQTWTAAFPKAGMAAESLCTRPAVTSVVEAYLQTLTSMQHREEIGELLNPTFMNYGLWTSAVIARLFRGTGLVVMEPRLLRPLAKSFFANVLAQRPAIRQALTAGAANLETLNLPASFKADTNFGLFHIGEDGHRRRLMERQGKLLFGHEWVEPEVVQAALESSAEEFSTSAFLRPVLQNVQIPTLAYVGGPGEFRYHLQLPALYELFGTSMPVLHLRNHATIVGPTEAKLAGKLKLTATDFFRAPEGFYHVEELPEQVGSAFDKADRDIAALLNGLEKAVEIPMDPRRFRGYEVRFRKDLANLRHKVRREYQRSSGVDNGRIDRFFAAIQPAHQPQDRALNVFYLIESFGPSLIRQLLELADPFENRHMIIRE